MEPENFYAFDGTWYHVVFEFDRAFIDDLKDRIPSKWRRWIPREKEWLLTPDGWALFLSLAAEYGMTLEETLWEDCFSEAPKAKPDDMEARVERLIEQNNRLLDRIAALELQIVGLRNQKPASTDPDLAALYLLPGSPPELVGAAYRALAHLWHPDKGGNLERMKALNVAHDRLQKRSKRA